MKRLWSIFYRYLISFWINPLLFLIWIKNIYRYISSFLTFQKNIIKKDFPIYCSYPCLHDKDDTSWVVNGHYYHQDLLIAQKIFKNNPKKHIDIWSRVDWFVAHVASYREVEVFDIRSLESKSKNIIFRQLDLMWDIPHEYIGCTDSLSCLHTIEHFWLWRYGDTIDCDWHIKGFQQMAKILKSWWTFYFSTPISKNQRIEFNAHRIFSLKYLIENMFQDIFEIISFSYVDDKWDLHKDIILDKKNISSVFNLNYGCGIFELKKR